MKLNHNKLGAACLAASPILINLSKGQAFWWIGVLFATLGPILIAIESKSS